MNIAGTQPANVINVFPERRIRLGNHLPGSTEAVEVIHIGRAQIGLQGIEQLGQRHALGFRLETVHLRIQLRHIGLITADGKTHPRGLRNGPLECIHGVLQLTIAQVAPVLDKQLIP